MLHFRLLLCHTMAESHITTVVVFQCVLHGSAQENTTYTVNSNGPKTTTSGPQTLPTGEDRNGRTLN